MHRTLGVHRPISCHEFTVFFNYFEISVAHGGPNNTGTIMIKLQNENNDSVKGGKINLASSADIHKKMSPVNNNDVLLHFSGSLNDIINFSTKFESLKIVNLLY